MRRQTLYSILANIPYYIRRYIVVNLACYIMWTTFIGQFVNSVGGEGMGYRGQMGDIVI